MLQVSDFDPSNTCSEQSPATSDKVHIVPRITFNIYCITKKISIHPTLAPNRGQPPATRSILYPGSPSNIDLKIDYRVFSPVLKTKEKRGQPPATRSILYPGSPEKKDQY